MSDNNNVVINFPDKPMPMQIHIRNSIIIVGSGNHDIESSIDDSVICFKRRNEAGGGGKDV